VPDAVRRLLDKFDYPDREPESQVIPILPSLGGGGGAPTLVVAASNAPQFTKDRADHVCTGINDETTVQAALDRMAGIRGRLVLTEGDFNFDATGVVVAADIEIQGMGFGTIINVGFTTGIVFDVASDCIIRDLQIGESVSI